MNLCLGNSGTKEIVVMNNVQNTRDTHQVFDYENEKERFYLFIYFIGLELKTFLIKALDSTVFRHDTPLSHTYLNLEIPLVMVSWKKSDVSQNVVFVKWMKIAEKLNATSATQKFTLKLLRKIFLIFI